MDGLHFASYCVASFLLVWYGMVASIQHQISSSITWDLFVVNIEKWFNVLCFVAKDDVSTCAILLVVRT